MAQLDRIEVPTVHGNTITLQEGVLVQGTYNDKRREGRVVQVGENNKTGIPYVNIEHPPNESGRRNTMMSLPMGGFDIEVV